MDTVSPDAAEEQRLAALHALDLLDTAREREFDAIARLASEATDCPTAVITLADRDRIWIKAIVGQADAETPRTHAVCDTTVRTDAPLIVEDLTLDSRFREFPAVLAGLRFYAGLPIHTTDCDGTRHPIGAVCVVDVVARCLSDVQRRTLDDLAVLTEAIISARVAARKALEHTIVLERQQRLFRQAERMARIGWWRLTLDDEDVEWSDGVFRIHELGTAVNPKLVNALDFYPPHARATVSTALTSTIQTGEPFDVETDFISAKGNALRVRSMGEVEWTDGRPSAVVGVFRDVTEEYGLKLALQRSADTDPLTGMPNRGAFCRTLDRAITAARADRSPLALALIDLDGFKRINDTFGHISGDDVLKTIARHLHAPWLKESCAARLGGDEFAVIIDDPQLLADDDVLIARLTSELRVSTWIGGLTLESGASVGLMRFDPDRFADQRELIQAADANLYIAKRNRVGERRAA